MRRSTITMPALAILCALATTGPARAAAPEIVDADPWQVIHFASEYGDADVRRDSHDEPVIHAKADVLAYRIYFYGCTLARDCGAVLFRARFPDAPELNPERLADRLAVWNRERVFGKAVLDSDAVPAVEMAVNLRAGVTTGNLRETFDWWDSVIGEFSDFIGY